MLGSTAQPDPPNMRRQQTTEPPEVSSQTAPENKPARARQQLEQATQRGNSPKRLAAVRARAFSTTAAEPAGKKLRTAKGPSGVSGDTAAPPTSDVDSDSSSDSNGQHAAPIHRDGADDGHMDGLEDTRKNIRTALQDAACKGPLKVVPGNTRANTPEAKHMATPKTPVTPLMPANMTETMADTSLALKDEADARTAAEANRLAALHEYRTTLETIQTQAEAEDWTPATLAIAVARLQYAFVQQYGFHPAGAVSAGAGPDMDGADVSTGVLPGRDK